MYCLVKYRSKRTGNQNHMRALLDYQVCSVMLNCTQPPSYIDFVVILRIIQRLSESGYNIHVCLLCMFISVNYLPRLVDTMNLQNWPTGGEAQRNFLLVRLNVINIGFVCSH